MKAHSVAVSQSNGTVIVRAREPVANLLLKIMRSEAAPKCLAAQEGDCLHESYGRDLGARAMIVRNPLY